MNKVILTGNLCREIELKTTTSGKEVVTNCVGVRRDFKGENGENDSDFINIVVWGASAVYLSRYAQKGDMVELVGRWTVRKYQDRNGSTQLVNECVVESIKILTKREPKETAPTWETVQNNADLPF